MASSFIFRPYPDPRKPAWFTPGSNQNFCEEDYVITSYIAEFINTLTNIAYIIYAIHGIWRLRQTRNDTTDWIIYLPYIGLVLVGIGSSAYHATLTYHGQMADELSMMLATSCILNRLLTYGQLPSYRRKVTLGIASIMCAIAVYHCAADEFIVHCIVFATMVIIIGNRTRALTKSRVKNREQRKRIEQCQILGTSCTFAAFVLWSIDRIFCAQLTQFKRSIGLPWGFIFELHGWWHILTSISSYVFMAIVEFLTDETRSGNGKEIHDVWPFAWPANWFLCGNLDSCPGQNCTAGPIGNGVAVSNGIMKGEDKKEL